MMNIYKSQDTFTIFFFTVSDQLFHRCDFRLQNVIHCVITCFSRIITLKVEPIKIFANETCSVITCYNSIWIGHWHYLKDKTVSEMTGIFGYQIVDHAVQDPRRICLSWVDSTTNDHCALLGSIYNIVSYRKQWDLKTTEWTSECRHRLVELGACFDSFLKEGVRVGNRLSNVNEFISTRKIKIEGETKVLLFALAHIKSCRNQCLFFYGLYLTFVIAVLCCSCDLAWVDLSVANVCKIASLPCNVFELLHDEPFVINFLEAS